MRKIKNKEMKYLMFKDIKRAKTLKFWTRFLSFFYVISWITLLATSFIYLGAIIMWPVVWVLMVIITLGTILLSYKEMPSIEPFLEKLEPIIISALIICVTLFLLRLIIKWFFIISESYALRKKEDENAHHIAIYKAVIKTEMSNFIVFLSIILSIILAVFIFGKLDSENVTNAQKNLSIIVLTILIVFPIMGKIYKKKAFSYVKPNALAVINERRDLLK